MSQEPAQDRTESDEQHESVRTGIPEYLDALTARIAELELACQRLRDDTQGAHAERDQAKAETERQAVLLRAINDCHRDPAQAILQADRVAGAAVIKAHAAEAETAALRARIEALADEWEQKAGEGSEAWRVFGAQVVSVPFMVSTLRALAGAPAVTPTETQAEGGALDLSGYEAAVRRHFDEPFASDLIAKAHTLLDPAPVADPTTHWLNEYGTTDCPVGKVRANADDEDGTLTCSACGAPVADPTTGETR